MCTLIFISIIFQNIPDYPDYLPEEEDDDYDGTGKVREKISTFQYIYSIAWCTYTCMRICMYMYACIRICDCVRVRFWICFMWVLVCYIYYCDIICYIVWTCYRVGFTSKSTLEMKYEVSFERVVACLVSIVDERRECSLINVCVVSLI